MSTDEAQVLIGTLGLLVNAVGLTFVAVQLAIARRQAHDEQMEQRAERERLRRQATVEFAANTLQVRSQLRSILPDDYDKDEISKLIVKCIAGNDPVLWKSVAMYLGYMETLAVATSTRIQDLETADCILGGRAIAIWTNYRRFIEHVRLLNGSNYFCRELEWLHGELIRFRATGRAYDSKGNYIPFAERSPGGRGPTP